MYNFEKKFYDFTLSDASLSAAAQAPLKAGIGPDPGSSTIVDIVQGTGESQRIGRKCTITKIMLRLNFEFLTADDATLNMANTAHETVRFMIYWDKQCNGAGISGTDMLETNVYNSYRNLANVQRFQILYDKTWAWNTTAIAASSAADQETTTAITVNSKRVISDYQKHINLNVFIPVEFDNTDGQLTGIKSNNVGIFIWTKHGTRMQLTNSICRLRFIDF